MDTIFNNVFYIRVYKRKKMSSFGLGFIVGMSIFLIIAYIGPLSISPVQEVLVEKNHGYYDSKTRKFILRECKE